MSNNNNLHKARIAKNDEFYTQYKDVEAECQHYSDQFKNQWIYLPCDDENSNFWKYFVTNFKNFELKRLTATHINFDGNSYRLDFDGSETLKTPLNGNGDFRSEECTKIKDECDIVITNPPFSLFRQFVSWLSMKKFLIIGNGNAVTYKDVFPLIKENKIWLGASKGLGGGMEFIINADLFDSSKCSNYREENGKYYINIMLSTWFTNLTHTNIDKPPLELHKHYNADEYPTYLNYNAINVDRVKDIPLDYDGVMGVPISFLDKYNPSQFEIVGFIPCDVPNGYKGMSKEFVDLYYSQGGTGQYSVGNNTAHYITNDGKARLVYKRILIKRK